MLSIVTPVYQAVKESSLKKIAWLGTRFTMEQPYFRKIFEENGAAIVIPEENEREIIDRIIAEELEFGIVNLDSKKQIDQIIRRLCSEENIEGIIMGCTELPLMYSEESLPVPVFDTMEYHIQGIVDHMFEE